jgi:hypothetical protein
VDSIHDEEEKDTSIEAQWRGRGVPQDVGAAVRSLQALQGNDAVLDGFAAALTEFVATSATGSWPDPGEYFRGLSYGDCVGGAGTVYQSEQEEEDASESAPTQPEEASEGLEDATTYTAQARALLPLLLTAAENLTADLAIRCRCKALLVGVDDALRLAAEATTAECLKGQIQTAEHLLHAATDAWSEATISSQFVANQVWGLHAGIVASIDEAVRRLSPSDEQVGEASA